MKKFIFSLTAIVTMLVMAPTSSNAQFDAAGFELAGYTPATSKAKVAIGKVTMLNTRNIKLVPEAQIYLLQDLADPKIFYVAVDLDEVMFKRICQKGDSVLYAQALEIDLAQTEIILRDYRNILDAKIAKIQEEINELKVKPDKESKADKKKRKADLVSKTAELAKAKKGKADLIAEFKKLIEMAAKSTKIYRIVHSQIVKERKV